MSMKREDFPIDKRAAYDQIMADFLEELNSECPPGDGERLDSGVNPKRTEITDKYLKKLEKLKS